MLKAEAEQETELLPAGRPSPAIPPHGQSDIKLQLAWREMGGGGELYPFLPVLRQDVRVLPTLCSCSPPEHLCIKSL